MAMTHFRSEASIQNKTPFEKELEREAYHEKAEAQLKKWRGRLLEIEAKGKEFSVDAKLKFTEYRDKLRHQIEKSEDGIETLKAVGEDTWEDAKIRMEYLWEGLEDTWAYWTSLLKKNTRK